MILSCMGNKLVFNIAILALLILCVFSKMNGQNLIRNGGFEGWLHWISDGANSISPNHWSYLGSPKWSFNSGAFMKYGNKRTAFTKQYGIQTPRHGNVVMLIAPYGNRKQGMNLINSMSDRLKKDRRYYFEFSVIRCNNSCHSTRQMDVLITKERIQRLPNYVLWDEFEPTFRNPLGPIKDSIHWTTIRGEIIAQGGERFFVVGNFDDQFQATFEPCDWPEKRLKQAKRKRTYENDAIYYIDDVMLKPMGWSENPTTVPQANSSAKEIARYCDSEFVFVRGDSAISVLNKELITDLAKHLRRNENTFVEFCISAYQDESEELILSRESAIRNEFAALGISDKQLSFTSYCDNSYKMGHFAVNGIQYIGGAVEYIFR